MRDLDRSLHALTVAEAAELLGLARVEHKLDHLTAAVEHIHRNIHRFEEQQMSTIAEVNDKLTETLKDVRRVLDLVKNAPAAAATQAEVDALAERLDSMDAEVEETSPEPTA